VRPGDTLYRLSKQHKVSLNELMAANGLTTPNLKPGQKLYLPAGKVAAKPVEKTETAALAPAQAPADWTGSYTIKSGESLYAIARRNNIKPDELQRYNGIADVRRIKPGMVLKMPAAAGSSVVAEAPAAAPVAPLPPGASTPIAQAPIAVTPPEQTANSGIAPAQPKILNSEPAARAPEQKVAELKSGQTATDAAPAASGSVAEGGKLRWPVKGKIVAPFGPRPDGTHNDGINVAVPMGTEVHAAESGTVAYAGSELKGYGNLVLLRHDNGLVTAYAHNEELAVKRGDKVKRGQVIAKAGKTGQVDQPQLHFEVRQGQKPVDPAPFLQ
jgi:murein DD-endopeptidase MepM/ murein hydrolase activator NlpD